ncbi:MAG TPA: TonB-dependent receptor [Thermoanaerobaculia bacterium]
MTSGLLVLAVLATAAVDPVPERVSEVIVVTATRTETRVADTPASVVVMDQVTLETTAAPTIDDALRQVAGFTLFRRAGSRVANPTAQGVTLRGIGASGASRALVLDEGIPLNDPFGGWVYWGRVPRAALERVEILRGGASDLYGSSAMGGVVQFIRRRSATMTADVSAGSQGTMNGMAFVSESSGEWHGSIAIDALSTDGFVLVRPEDRGGVDVEAGTQHVNLDATLRYSGAFLRGSHFREKRDNGTPLQENDTTTRQVSAGLTTSLSGGALDVRAYGTDQDYFQTFTAVAADRRSERLTVEQNVPSRALGGSLQWTRGFGGRHVVVAGTDLRDVHGTSDELRFTPAGQLRVAVDGRQRSGGIYLENVFAVSNELSVTAGIRADSWRNEGLDATRRESAWNPRVALLWRVDDRLAVSGSWYRAYRAPTLNELYRGFRVGNVETLPNARLGSESLDGYELGVRSGPFRVTLFAMDVSDAIANFTLDASGPTIVRQRRNIGATRSRGIEADGEWRLGTAWRASAGWMYVDAELRDDGLRGNRVPQVPRQQLTAQLIRTGSVTGGVQARWSDMQYDDDRNALPLASYAVTDLFLAVPLANRLAMTFAVENVFDEQVEVSATPVISIGQPRAWRVGVRYGR